MSRAAHLQSVEAVRIETNRLDDAVNRLRLDAVTATLSLAVSALGEFPEGAEAQGVMAELHGADEALRDASRACERAVQHLLAYARAL